MSSARRALPSDTAYLGLFDAEMIELTLSRSCTLERAIGTSRTVARVFAPVDDQRSAISEINCRLRDKAVKLPL